jgi:hypothetical protein
MEIFGNQRQQRQVNFVRRSAIWVGFYPLGRQFCPFDAFFNGAAFVAAIFSTFSAAFFYDSSPG